MKKLLLLLAIPLLMGAGCATKDNDNTSTQKYIEVKELGFRIPVDDAWADQITYQDVEDFTVGFSTKELNDASEYCSDGAGGRISFISDTPSHPGMGSAEYFAGREDDIKQFDGFFLFYSHPQATCTEDMHEKESELIDVIKAGFDNAEFIGLPQQ